MKILQINTFSNGSTGSIMINIHKSLINEGIESHVAWARGRKPKNNNEILIGNKLNVYFHAFYTRITDKTGFASRGATKKILKKIDEIKPDIVHLHNIHGYYINIELLFNYLKENNIKVVWTLHDCWSFTGHCAYFSFIGCDKWKKQCNKCPQLKNYPKSFVDNSQWNYVKKKELFSGLDLTIVTPSSWLANEVKKSFLGDYNIKIINNGIETNIFKPTKSNFKNNYNINNKKMILGVANTWDKRKGLDDFIQLSKMIDERFKIVLVGLNKKQIKLLPDNIIGIERTENIQELVDIYNAADYYFNASKEETFGMTTIEALACNTYPIVYNKSALPEIVKEYGYGSIIDKLDDIIPLLKKDYKINFDRKVLDVDNMCNKYIDVYKSLVNNK